MLRVWTCLLLACIAHAQELKIAAASDLSAAFKDVVAAFEKHSGARVKVSFGSSGNFFAQIQNGAPFDLFFSADVNYPQKLVEAGFAERESLYEYAIGRLVLWVPRSSPLDVERSGLEALRHASAKKIAIANPQHAPYGRAAVAALEKEGVYTAIKNKLVLGENVSQAAQFVQSGNADVGLIALSLALAPQMKDGKYWLVPESMHPPLRQAAIIVRSSRAKQAARDFLAFLRAKEGQAIMERYGFKLPEQ